MNKRMAAPIPARWRRLAHRRETMAGGPRRALADTYLGQLVSAARLDTWWENKLACLLGTAYALAFVLRVPAADLAWRLLEIVAAFIPGAAFVCLINDITDAEEDRRAGKPNRMAERPAWFQVLAVSGCLAAGAAAAWVMRAYPVTLSFYAANWLAFSLYSVPPFRWKTRGAWGVLADACGGQFLPTMWIAALVCESSGHAFRPPLAIALAGWSFALGIRGIVSHQLRDYENDRIAAVNTWVVRTGTQRARRVVAWGCLPVEVSALLGVLILIGAPLAWPFLALHLFFEWRRLRAARIFANWRTPEPEKTWPLAEYYQWFYPMTFALSLAWREPLYWILVAAQIVLFRHCTVRVARDCRRLFIW